MCKEKIKFDQVENVIKKNPNLVTLLFKELEPGVGTPRDIFSLSGNDCFNIIQIAICKSNTISSYDNKFLDLSYLKELPHIIKGNTDDKGYNYEYPLVKNNEFNINTLSSSAVQENLRACIFTVNDTLEINKNILYAFSRELKKKYPDPINDKACEFDEFLYSTFGEYSPSNIREFFNKYTPFIYTEQSLQLQFLKDLVIYPKLILRIAKALGNKITEKAAIEVCKICSSEYFYDAVKNNYLSFNTIEKIIGEFPELIDSFTDSYDDDFSEQLKLLRIKALKSNYRRKPVDFKLDYDSDETIALIFKKE